jgi:ATP-binding cassette subfamily D (ALD) long-chain fatty acid import protein
MKIRYNMLEDFVLKYSWSAFGYLITSLPIFLPAWGGLGGLLELATPSSSATSGRQQDRMKAFITNKRLMLSLADAGGRMMYSIKDLSELTGYTSRVYSLVSILHRTHSFAYFSSRPELYSLADIQGTLHKGFEGIRLEGIPIVAPGLWPRGGEEIVYDIDITIRPGNHLLISGPNGAGKSSVARVIAGLWPVYRGLVSRPRNVSNAGLPSASAITGGVMFLPQRPYLAQGTLRDQLIYPHTEADMRASGVSDEHLLPILEAVKLSYLPTREGGWDTKKEWKDVLSGGEKQRISLARIVYHQPSFAVLDEPTSAVSSDVEGHLYAVCKERGITIVTMSTRASLKKYHSFQLTLDGHGGWNLERIGGEVERGEVERELEELREKVRLAEEAQKRLEVVKEELGRVWVQGGKELEGSVSDNYEELPVEKRNELERSYEEVGEGENYAEAAKMGESAYTEVLDEELEGLEVPGGSESANLGRSYAEVRAESDSQLPVDDPFTAKAPKEGESYTDAVKNGA